MYYSNANPFHDDNNDNNDENDNNDNTKLNIIITHKQSCFKRIRCFKIDYSSNKA